jgi:hypothetical protein
MKSNKITNIQDLTLNNPSAKIKRVEYDWDNDFAFVEVIFQEENSLHKHSRSFEMNTNGELVSPDQIKEFIKNELKDFE